MALILSPLLRCAPVFVVALVPPIPCAGLWVKAFVDRHLLDEKLSAQLQDTVEILFRKRYKKNQRGEV